MVTSICVLVGVLAAGQLDPLTHQASLSAGLDNPARVAVTGSEILVADPRADAVVRFDLAGAYLGTWSEPAGPVGVAVHPDGRIFVSRRDDAKVGVYDPSFVFQHFLADGVVSFVEPTDLAVDPLSGRLYVVDSGGDAFYGFESDESLALIVGVRGSRTGEFIRPGAIAVDPANNRVLVADQENFRVQVFNTSGLFLFKFGYRIKYLAGGLSEGWFPRTVGLAVDGSGRMYVTDALMSTVRIFDTLGAELGKVVDYGSGPGELRTPGGLAIDGAGRVLVANSNAGQVEIYDAPSARALSESSGVWFEGSNEITGPLDWGRGGGRSPLSAFNQPGRLLSGARGAGSGQGTRIPGWEPPHWLDDLTCGRCHGVNEQPGGHEGTAEGQANLCFSCHSGAGQALVSSFRSSDASDPYGTNPNLADGRGKSHAWGVAVVSADADSIGPAAGGEMERFLDGDQLICATCHNLHNHDAGFPKPVGAERTPSSLSAIFAATFSCSALSCPMNRISIARPSNRSSLNSIEIPCKSRNVRRSSKQPRGSAKWRGNSSAQLMIRGLPKVESRMAWAA